MTIHAVITKHIQPVKHYGGKPRKRTGPTTKVVAALTKELVLLQAIGKLHAEPINQTPARQHTVAIEVAEFMATELAPIS